MQWFYYVSICLLTKIVSHKIWEIMCHLIFFVLTLFIYLSLQIKKINRNFPVNQQVRWRNTWKVKLYIYFIVFIIKDNLD